MFLVCTVEDNVRILPCNLGRPAQEAVANALEKAFVDRVVTDAGLVVTVYDILSIDGGFVFHSDGAAHFKVSFRLVVFRPLVGEVLTGTLKRCNRSGHTFHVRSLDCRSNCRPLAAISPKPSRNGGRQDGN